MAVFAVACDQTMIEMQVWVCIPEESNNASSHPQTEHQLTDQIDSVLGKRDTIALWGQCYDSVVCCENSVHRLLSSV
jgi:hypothetical protein